MSEQQDQFDELLDEALASYGKAPEIEGLEERILARTAGKAPRRFLTRLWRPVKPLPLAFGTALVTMTACLFWWTTTRTGAQRIQTSGGVRTQKTLAAPPLSPLVYLPVFPAVLRVDARLQGIRKKPAAPKLARFPTPSALSNEEQALVQLVSGNGDHVPRELMNFGGPIRQIEITAVEVKPLELR